MKKKTIIYGMIITAALFAVGAFILWPSMLSNVSAQNTPQQSVASYYAWYLDSIRDPRDEKMGNPLIDRAYRNSNLLSPSFIGHIDEMLASSDGIPADPFLCAQDIPQEINIQGVFKKGRQAQVVVRTDFSGHVFTADVQEKKGWWRISNVTCGGTPAGNAKAFYAWYLGYIETPSQDKFKNPLVDRAYQQCQFISQGFTASVDEMLSTESLGGFDPFLLAQDIPVDFSVDPGLTADTAVVHFQFGDSIVRHVRVTFVHENGFLLINSVEEDTR